VARRHAADRDIVGEPVGLTVATKGE